MVMNELPDVLDGRVFGLSGRGSPQIFVQGGENLGIQHLEAANSVDHPFQLLKSWNIRVIIALFNTYDSLDVFVLSVDFLHPEDVIAKVQAFKTSLLIQENDQNGAGPVQALAEQLP